MPAMNGFEEYNHLSEASSLCGSCTENCPMNINLHHLLVHNRRTAVEKNSSLQEKIIWKAWQKAMQNRKMMNVSSYYRNLLLQFFMKKSWGARREFPELAKESFNEMWRNGKVS
jgi:L-lactate dehydrogenase complex protein LldF